MLIWKGKNVFINSNVYFFICFMFCRYILLCRYYNLMKMGKKNYVIFNDGKDEGGFRMYGSNKRD